MKNLTLLNDNTSFKLNDTGTVIQFKADNENQPVGITEGQSAVFRIKNEFGFLKSVNATTSYGGYVFELDTSSLTDLVAGSYDIELAITLSEDDVLIFPDDGFVSIKITKNALNITGEQLPMMSLDSFKNELKTYVDNETEALKSDFETYVASVKTGPQGEPGKDGTNGKDGVQGPQGDAATINIGTVSTLDSSQQAYVNNTGSDADAVFNFGIPKGPQGETGEKGEKGDTGDVSAYCNSTGWLQEGLTFPTNAISKKGFYKIDTINGSSVLEFYVTVVYAKTDVDSWGDVIFTLPSNVTVLDGANYFYDCYTNYGYGNLKYRNGSIVVNQPGNFGNADSTGNYEIDVHGRIPVTMSN